MIVSSRAEVVESAEKARENEYVGGKCNFAVKFLDFFMISIACGDTTLVLFLKCYLIAAFVVTTSGQIWTLIYADGPLFVAKTMIYIVAGITYNFMTLLLNRNKKHILGMRSSMMENFNEQFYNDLPKSASASEKFQKLFRAFLPIYLLIYSFSLVGPLLSFPYSGKKLGDMYTLMLPCRYPWKFDTYPKYMATYALQFACLAPLSVPVICNNLFLAYFIMEIQTQSEILCAAIHSIKSSSESVIVNAKKGEWKSCDNEFQRDRIQKRAYQHFHKHTHDRLIHCTRHYQQIIKFVHHFTQSYNGVFIVSLVYSAPSLTLAGYTILIGENDAWDIIQYLSVLFLGLMEVFLYCFLGELFNDVYKNVRMSLYSTDWYLYPVVYRKTLINFMQNTHKNVSLKASSKHTASFRLYFSILKTCYSYMNVLREATIKYNKRHKM